MGVVRSNATQTLISRLRNVVAIPLLVEGVKKQGAIRELGSIAASFRHCGNT